MMPIFFNLESHLWIAFLLFFNGGLISWQLRRVSVDYHQLTSSVEAQVLAAFFLSIGLNGVLLLAMQWLGLSFTNVGSLLFLVSAVLIATALLNRKKMPSLVQSDISWIRLSLYSFIFVMLFYNGGLIETVSDAWWHMSLANKIGLESSFIPEKGHLIGLPTRYYPPLWHANLALIQIVSGETLPVIWNSFTAWGAVLKVMSFYLFARALTQSGGVATLAAILFILLPGIGNSYLRVSAWPSHIAYTAWFFTLHLLFVVLDRLPTELPKRKEIWPLIKLMLVPIIGMIFLLLVILFSHKAELLYLAVAITAYFIALAIRKALLDETATVAAEPGYLGVYVGGVIVSFIALSVTALRVAEKITADTLSLDLIIANLWPALLLVMAVLLCLFPERLPRKFIKLILSLLALSLLALIDWRHVSSLFQPELAYVMTGAHEQALKAPGWFGAELKIPGWHLQLRSGLLYSGVLALPISAILAIAQPTRASLFVAANAWAVVLICCSPYLYQWLADLLNYHSPWRIAILVFHPLVIAMAFRELWKVMRGEEG